MNTITHIVTIFFYISIIAIPALSQDKKPEKETTIMVATITPYKSEIKTGEELRIPIDNKRFSRVKVVIHIVTCLKKSRFSGGLRFYRA